MVCHPLAKTCYDQPAYQIKSLEQYLYPHYEDIKGDTEYEKWGGLS